MIELLLTEYALSLLLRQLLAHGPGSQQRHSPAAIEKPEILEPAPLEELGHPLIMLLLGDAFVDAGLPRVVRLVLIASIN